MTKGHMSGKAGSGSAGKKGTWKKERAVGRKYSGGDTEAKPVPHKRKKYWVGNYHKKDKKISESWRKNPAFIKRKSGKAGSGSAGK